MERGEAMSAPQTDVRVGRAVRARGLGFEYVDSGGVGVRLSCGADAYLDFDTEGDTSGRVRVSFGWPHGVTYAVAQMGVFSDFVTALNFAVWADKAEAARLSRGGEPGNRFGAGDYAELVAPVT